MQLKARFLMHVKAFRSLKTLVALVTFSLEFLYDMSYCGLIDKNEYRLIFLKEVTPLLEHAGTAVNLTLYNWLELALHALQGQTTESITQGTDSHCHA